MSDSRADNSAGQDPMLAWSSGEDDEGGEAQMSQGPSGQLNVETLGGADSVPETPDNVPAEQDQGIRQSGLRAPVSRDGSGGSTTPDL